MKSESSLTALIDDIITTHHTYLKKSLPELFELIRQLADQDKNPHLIELKNIFTSFFIDINTHLTREENILFPLIRKIDKEKVLDSDELNMLDCAVKKLETEHKELASTVKKIRQLCSDYKVPENASVDLRKLYTALEKLEEDMQVHSHKEDDILFPKALAKIR